MCSTSFSSNRTRPNEFHCTPTSRAMSSRSSLETRPGLKRSPSRRQWILSSQKHNLKKTLIDFNNSVFGNEVNNSIRYEITATFLCIYFLLDQLSNLTTVQVYEVSLRDSGWQGRNVRIGISLKRKCLLAGKGKTFLHSLPVCWSLWSKYWETKRKQTLNIFSKF